VRENAKLKWITFQVYILDLNETVNNLHEWKFQIPCSCNCCPLIRPHVASSIFKMALHLP
jgi:hypothetical protein